MPYIMVTYEKWTEADREAGETRDIGIDHEHLDCTPDAWDIEDGLDTPVKIACHHIREGFAYRPSSSQWHPGLWYSTDAETGTIKSIEKGIDKYLSFHLYEFTEAEEREVFETLKAEKFLIL